MYKIITVYHPRHEKYINELKTVISEHQMGDGWLFTEGVSPYGCKERNMLVQCVRDEDYCCFLDADDMPTSFWLNEVKKHDADIIYGDTIFLTRKQMTIYHKTQSVDLGVMRYKNIIPDSGTCVRAKIAKQVLRVPVEYGKDWIWYAKLINHTNSIVYTGQPHIYARNYTSTRWFKKFPILRKMARKYYYAKTQKMVAKEIDFAQTQNCIFEDSEVCVKLYDGTHTHL